MSDVIIARGSSPILSSKSMAEKEFKPCWLITENTAFKPPKTGNYRVFCVGNGADGFEGSDNRYTAGAAGGVGVLDVLLDKSKTYNCTFNGSTSMSTSSTNARNNRTYANFDNLCIAYGGFSSYIANGNSKSAYTEPGYAVGNNVISFNGKNASTKRIYFQDIMIAGSVSLYIPGYMSDLGAERGGVGIFGGNPASYEWVGYSNGYNKVYVEGGIGAGVGSKDVKGGGGFGGGGGCFNNVAHAYGGDGCILIQYVD